jgi:hypothetical protein
MKTVHNRKKSSLIKLPILLSIVILSILTSHIVLSKPIPTERQLRNQVVKLISKSGTCSGEQVRAPSGIDYILTAAHCKNLDEGTGSIVVITEQGRIIKRKIIEEDPYSDLLLLEGVPNLVGMNIANSISKTQHVRSFTHGAGLDTYKTEGELIQYMLINIPIKQIEDPDKETGCTDPKHEIQTVDTYIWSSDHVFLKSCRSSYNG